MVALSFRFLAGRYHATPWAAHVNEGLVEWPPSPWRVLRALLAAGFSRLGWTQTPELAGSLVAKLATQPPRVFLPPAFAAHTRHYMPLFKERTTKVLDTFAHVGDGELTLAWDVDLDASERELLGALAATLPYLGRAESWVECRLRDDEPTSQACVAAEGPPGPGFERVSLLAPESPSAFARWREDALAREREASFARAVAKAEAAGKKTPKSLSASETKKLDAAFPSDLLTALLVDTNTLRSQGWSQPPGSRWLSYWRPVDALRSAVPTMTVRRQSATPTTALLALASDTRNHEALPRLRDAVLRMEVLHEALVRASDPDAIGRASVVFTGKEQGAPLTGHRHAKLIALSLDGRADTIDHVLVHAPMGFDAAARNALTSVTRTWAKDLPTIFVSLAGLGTEADFSSLVPEVRRSTSWVSRTPFVPPRFLKATGKNDIEGQIRAELDSRGVNVPVRVEVLDDGRRFRWFRRARRAPHRAPPTPIGLALRLVFERAVEGPISLGYASHFGLGSFVPG